MQHRPTSIQVLSQIPKPGKSEDLLGSLMLVYKEVNYEN